MYITLIVCKVKCLNDQLRLNVKIVELPTSFSGPSLGTEHASSTVPPSPLFPHQDGRLR